MLKAEIGNSLDVGVNTSDDARFNLLLSNKQQELAAAYDFPFLRTRIDVAMVAGTRFYTLPAINFDREHVCEISWNNIWTPMRYGIREYDYNLVNSLMNIGVDPVKKWLITSPTQFEVWPIPQSAQTVRFTGMLVPSALTTDGDTAVLDDLLLAYFVAAEEAARRKDADASLKVQKANMRLALLRGAGPTRNSVFLIGSEELNMSRKGRKKVLL
jgi:hypothetical protein